MNTSKSQQSRFQRLWATSGALPSCIKPLWDRPFLTRFWRYMRHLKKLSNLPDSSSASSFRLELVYLLAHEVALVRHESGDYSIYFSPSAWDVPASDRKPDAHHPRYDKDHNIGILFDTSDPSQDEFYGDMTGKEAVSVAETLLQPKGMVLWFKSPENITRSRQ